MGNKQKKIFVTLVSSLFVIAVIIVGFQFTDQQGDILKRPTLESKEVINLASTRDAGTYLTDFTGRALYVYTGDRVEDNLLRDGCIGDCAINWHPYRASGERSFRDSSDPFLRIITVVERPGNRFQFALDDQPLYRFSGDENVGDTNGMNQEGWQLVTLDMLLKSKTGSTPPEVLQQ